MIIQPPSLVAQANGVRTTKQYRLSDYVVAYSTSALPTIAGNCSSASYNPLTQTLMVSDNGIPVLHEFYLDGTYRRQVTLSGFTDVESVCWLEGTRYIIGEEGNPAVVNTICEIDIPATGAVTVTKGAGNWIRTITTGIASGSNLAIEGIAYDPARQLFYCITEKANVGVWNVWYVARSGGSAASLFSLVTPMTGVATDLSDLFYDRTEDVLYILSDESKKVIKMNLTGVILEQVAVPSLFTQPEGLCFTYDMKTMFITGETKQFARMPLQKP